MPRGIFKHCFVKCKRAIILQRCWQYGLNVFVWAEALFEIDVFRRIGFEADDFVSTLMRYVDFGAKSIFAWWPPKADSMTRSFFSPKIAKKKIMARYFFWWMPHFKYRSIRQSVSSHNAVWKRHILGVECVQTVVGTQKDVVLRTIDRHSKRWCVWALVFWQAGRWGRDSLIILPRTMPKNWQNRFFCSRNAKNASENTLFRYRFWTFICIVQKSQRRQRSFRTVAVCNVWMRTPRLLHAIVKMKSSFFWSTPKKNTLFSFFPTIASF